MVYINIQQGLTSLISRFKKHEEQTPLQITLNLMTSQTIELSQIYSSPINLK